MPPPWRDTPVPDVELTSMNVKAFIETSDLVAMLSEPDPAIVPSVMRAAQIKGPIQIDARRWLLTHHEAILPTIFETAFCRTPRAREYGRAALERLHQQIDPVVLLDAATRVSQEVGDTVSEWLVGPRATMTAPRVDRSWNIADCSALSTRQGRQLTIEETEIAVEALIIGSPWADDVYETVDPVSLERLACDVYAKSTDSEWVRSCLSRVGGELTVATLRAAAGRAVSGWTPGMISILRDIEDCPHATLVLAELADWTSRTWQAKPAQSALATCATRNETTAFELVLNAISSFTEHPDWIEKMLLSWLENAMFTRQSLRARTLRRSLDQPAVAGHLRTLIWQRQDSTFFIDEDGSWRDLEDRIVKVKDSEELAIMHPARVSADVARRWEALFADFVIVQSIEQLGREVFRGTIDDLREYVASKRIDNARLSEALHQPMAGCDDGFAAAFTSLIALVAKDIRVVVRVAPRFNKHPALDTAYRVDDIAFHSTVSGRDILAPEALVSEGFRFVRKFVD